MKEKRLNRSIGILFGVLILIFTVSIVQLFCENIPWEKSEEYTTVRAMASDKFWESEMYLEFPGSPRHQTVGEFFLRPFKKEKFMKDMDVRFDFIDDQRGIIQWKTYYQDIRTSTLTFKFYDELLLNSVALFNYVEISNLQGTERTVNTFDVAIILQLLESGFYLDKVEYGQDD